MRKGKRLLGCALGALLGCSLLLGGCNNSMFDFGGWEYPDFPLADSDDTIDSWTQWEEDEIIEILGYAEHDPLKAADLPPQTIVPRKNRAPKG